MDNSEFVRYTIAGILQIVDDLDLKTERIPDEDVSYIFRTGIA